MDAFYAAVEERDRPELRGKPVIIGADPKGGAGRGVVSTANYAARKFGVGSAMPISTASRLCPQGVFIPPDMAKYGAISKEIRTIFEDAALGDYVRRRSDRSSSGPVGNAQKDE